METNLFPKNVFKGTNSDGSSFTAREYDFDTYATLEVGSLVLMLFGGAILGVFLAPLLFVLSVLSFDGYSKIKFWITGIISAYVLFDFSHGWLMLRLLDFFFSESSLNTLLAVNTGVLIGCIGVILIGRVLRESLGNAYIIATLVIFFIGFAMVKTTVSTDTGWVRQELKLDEKPRQDDYEKYSNMTDKEIEDEAQQRYEDQLRSEGKDPADYR